MFSTLTRIRAFGVSLGFFATGVQVFLLRGTLSFCSGSELILGAALAVWLVGVSLGALAAFPFRTSRLLLTLGAIAATALSFAAPLLQRLLPLWLDTPTGAPVSTAGQLLIILLSLSPPAIACGFLFVIASRPRSPVNETNIPARLYTAEAIGALISGVVITFALHGRVDPLAIAIISGLALVWSSLFFPDPSPSGAPRIIAAAFTTLAAAAVATGMTAQIDRKITSIDSTGPWGITRSTQDTPYGRLVLKEREGEFAVIRDGSVVFSFPDRWDAPATVHLALSLHPSPNRLLLLEGPAPDQIRAALDHRIAHVDSLSLDPGEDQLVAPFLSDEARTTMSLPNVRRVFGDSRLWMRAAGPVYDVILATVPPPLSAASNRFHTVEFFEAAATALSPGGILVVETPGSATRLTDTGAVRFAGALATMKQVFAEVVIVPGTATLFVARGTHNTVSSNKNQPRLDVRGETLMDRFKTRVRPETPIPAELLRDRVEERRIVAFLRQLEQTPATINRDSSPVGYLEGLALDEQRRGDWKLIGGAADLAVPLIVIFPAVLVLFLTFRATRSAAPPLFGVFTTGFCGMGAEIVLLFSFGANYGQVFSGLAWIIAAFMLGLAAGAAIGTRLGTGRSARLIADLSSAAVLITIPLVLQTTSPSAFAYAILTILAGITTGAGFSVFLNGLAGPRWNRAMPAVSVVLAVDCAGAALGALLTAISLVPALGLSGACLAFASLKLLSGGANGVFFQKSRSDS